MATIKAKHDGEVLRYEGMEIIHIAKQMGSRKSNSHKVAHEIYVMPELEKIYYEFARTKQFVYLEEIGDKTDMPDYYKKFVDNSDPKWLKLNRYILDIELENNG